MQRDFLNRLLCDSCWNGRHNKPSTELTGQSGYLRVNLCEGGKCECLCRVAAAMREDFEQEKRRITEKQWNRQRELFPMT